MAFNLDTWTRQTVAFNSGLLLMDDGSSSNGPAFFTYSSADDTIAVISAANYFSPVVVDLKENDIIAIVGSDYNALFMVSAADEDAGTVTIVPFGAGDISIPVELDQGGTGASLSSLPNSVFAIDGSGNTLLTTTLPEGLAANPPSADADVATKGYVDAAVAGINPTPACYAASTTNLTSWVYNNGASGVGATLTAPSNGVFTVDGVTPPAAALFLYKDDSTGSGAYNGIYNVTVPGTVSTLAVLTRATFYDSPGAINSTGIIPVLNGTSNEDTSWLRTNVIATVGVTPIIFVQFGQPHINFPLSMALGGTNANLTPVANSLLYTNSSATTLLPTVASKVLSTDSSGNLFWGDEGGGNINPGTINQLPYYAAAGDTLSPLNTQNSAVLVTTAAGVPQYTATMTNGQVVIGSNSGMPLPGTITAGVGINVTNGLNTITISATGGSANINPGTASALGYYAASGTTISPITTANSATLITNNAGAPSYTASFTNGQVLIGSSGGTPAPSTLSAGAGINITNGANSITIAATGSGANINPGTLSALAFYSAAGTTISPVTTANSATLVTTNAGVPQYTPPMTNGQVLIGSTGAIPVPANLIAGSNISISNGANSITISATGASPVSGSFSPTFKIGGSEPTYSTIGYYVTSNGLCTIQFTINMVNLDGLTGDVTIENLPVASRNTVGVINPVFFATTATNAGGSIGALLINSSTILNVIVQTTTGLVFSSESNYTNTSTINCLMTYLV